MLTSCGASALGYKPNGASELVDARSQPQAALQQGCMLDRPCATLHGPISHITFGMRQVAETTQGAQGGRLRDKMLCTQLRTSAQAQQCSHRLDGSQEGSTNMQQMSVRLVRAQYAHVLVHFKGYVHVRYRCVVLGYVKALFLARGL